MALIPKIKDNVYAQLDSVALISSTSFVLASGQGVRFPQPKNGSATSAGSTTVLNCTGIAALGVEVGDIIINLTDSTPVSDAWSAAVVRSVSTDSITTSPLVGGSDNAWENGDAWCIDPIMINLSKRAGGVITDEKTAFEKILITNRASDTLSIPQVSGYRGKNGTTIQEFSVGDFATIENDQSFGDGLKKMLTDVLANPNSQSIADTYSTQTIAGAKTFSIVPKSSQDPSAGDDLIRKSWFDANASSGLPINLNVIDEFTEGDAAIIVGGNYALNAKGGTVFTDTATTLNAAFTNNITVIKDISGNFGVIAYAKSTTQTGIRAFTVNAGLTGITLAAETVFTNGGALASKDLVLQQATDGTYMLAYIADDNATINLRGFTVDASTKAITSLSAELQVKSAASHRIKFMEYDSVNNKFLLGYMNATTGFVYPFTKTGTLPNAGTETTAFTGASSSENLMSCYFDAASETFHLIYILSNTATTLSSKEIDVSSGITLTSRLSAAIQAGTKYITAAWYDTDLEQGYFALSSANEFSNPIINEKLHYNHGTTHTLYLVDFSAITLGKITAAGSFLAYDTVGAIPYDITLSGNTVEVLSNNQRTMYPAGNGNYFVFSQESSGPYYLAYNHAYRSACSRPTAVANGDYTTGLQPFADATIPYEATTDKFTAGARYCYQPTGWAPVSSTNQETAAIALTPRKILIA